MRHEYAFDVMLSAVVRVRAKTLAGARKQLGLVLDAFSPTEDWIRGFNAAGLVVTECRLSPDTGAYEHDAELFEIDGKDAN